MLDLFSTLVDKISVFLAPRKGLLPLLGIVLIIVNLIFQFFPLGWLRDSNLFFHFCKRSHACQEHACRIFSQGVGIYEMAGF